MFKYKAMLIVLLTAVFTAGTAYCQEKAGSQKMDIITAAVSSVDPVGGTIELETNDGHMSFSIPDSAKITQGNKSIGLMDIEEQDPVTIRYYSSSSDENVAVSIVDNGLQDDVDGSLANDAG